jgi:hypothetical protein
VNVDGADGSENLRERSITHTFQKRVWLSLSEIVERATLVWPRALNLCYYRRVKRIVNTLESLSHGSEGLMSSLRLVVSMSDAQLIPPTANCLRRPT